MLFGSLTSIENWGAVDPRPGIPLSEIHPVSSRAEALLSRNATLPILKTNFIHVIGAIQMIAGMDYHAANFVRLATGPTTTLEIPTAVDHEATAYLNRLGQFRTFAKSTFVLNVVPNALNFVPSLERLLVFRNKISAHRSLDAPRGEPLSEQVRHAVSMTPMAGRLYEPRPGSSMPDKPDLTSMSIIDYLNSCRAASCLAYQIVDATTGRHQNFVLELDHPLVASECFALLEAILS